jgi:hydroxymethylglutaryl-CoA lyase
MTTRLHLTECPRDAMQGIHQFIPTHEKIGYLNALLKVGFPVLDAGSFVSAKSIPQLADSKEVLSKIEWQNSKSKILAIIANKRGAEEALACDGVEFLGFPFSVSETFQMRNTNSTISESYQRVSDIQELCIKSNKKLRVYLSMAFGNPYGDAWSDELVYTQALRIKELGIDFISLADTTGVSTPESIHYIFTKLVAALPDTELSAHLHALPESVIPKLQAAWNAGCRYFDTALHGFGGCPLAADQLTGNMATELAVDWAQSNGFETGIDVQAFQAANEMALHIFNSYQ